MRACAVLYEQQRSNTKYAGLRHGPQPLCRLGAKQDEPFSCTSDEKFAIIFLNIQEQSYTLNVVYKMEDTSLGRRRMYMPIRVKRKNGEITPFRNAEYIPAYYFIPKSVLDGCGKEMNSLPRNPKEILRSWDAIALVESDLFQMIIIDTYAYMVWPYMMPGVKREIYSGYEPAWILAHSPSFWVQEMTDVGIIPTVEALFRSSDMDKPLGYVTDDAIALLFSWLVPQVMERHHMNEVIEAADEYRCFEDFDYRSSRQKTDFYRRWYHTRTRHPMMSLEQLQEEYSEDHDGQEWNCTDLSAETEPEIMAQVQVDEFMSTLSDKDKQILQMRMEGRTLEDIADELGYKNHSGVLKRIRKIGQAYEKYAGVDYGFSDKRII